MRILTTQVLEDLWASMPIVLGPTEMTVSLSDYPSLRSNREPLMGWELMRLWVDPTLKRGECYEGRPDKERLGEQFKDWLVVNPMETES